MDPHETESHAIILYVSGHHCTGLWIQIIEISILRICKPAGLHRSLGTVRYRIQIIPVSIHILKMYKSLTFFLFNVRMTKKKRVLRPYSIITQAGCSLLFLCAKYHKDTFFHLHRAAQAFLLRKYYSESRCHFLRKQADQIVHHNDTNHF